jgi:uncharacterized repeat protein (TIGR03803 family)
MNILLKNLFLSLALTAGLGLMMAGRATAQTFTNLHNFTGSDGADPLSGVILSGNTLYGTAYNGGSHGSGTVFAVNTNGSGFVNLYSFTAISHSNETNKDGAFPNAVVLSGSTLYGTALYGGSNGVGTVFAVNTNGTGFTNLYSFNGLLNYNYTNSGGAEPTAGLTLSGNTLYGTALWGGPNGKGTVFAIKTNGTGYTTLHNFTAYDGFDVFAGLIISGNTLYGTVSEIIDGSGTVFALNTNGAGFTNLYNFTFTGGSDGAQPYAGLTLSGNTLYGTAVDGGASGNGTVFAVNTDGTGFRNLHSFTVTHTNSSGVYTNSDGANPYAGLNLSGSTLYGTTSAGGISGNGTVFAVNTDGTGFRNLHSFTVTHTNSNGVYTNSDGANPQAGLILSGSTLYGTAENGGTNGNGTVFSISLPFSVTTDILPSGTNGVAYNQTLTAIGGKTPYSWTNSSGALAPGLSLSTSGVISGTPTTNGTFNFTIKVTDASSATVTQALLLTVIGLPSVAWQTTNNPIWVSVGSNVTLAVSVAGTGPFSYQWQLNGTNLPDGIITTVAGNGTASYNCDGIAATNAELYQPTGVAVDVIGNLFIADCGNNRIRKIGTNGIITTVAGNGTNAYFGDGGAATNAELGNPYGVALDTSGDLLIADYENNRIRKVGTNGIITTVAGNGTNAYFGDGGAATNAELYYPLGVALDTSGNLFIADRQNNRIRKVGTNGIITTVAGNGTNAYFGDGSAATNAELNDPWGVTVDASGNLFIVDWGNSVIRKVDTNGIITTVAGNGTGGYSGDGGVATSAELSNPSAVSVDAFGNLFIADSENSRVRKVGTNGIITTVAGVGSSDFYGVYGAGYSGDGGTATNAELNWPSGVAVDATGDLFIADQLNNRIREVVYPSPTLILNSVGIGSAGAYDVVVSSQYGSVTSSVVNVTFIPPSVALQTTNNSIAVMVGSNVTLAVSVTGAGPFSYQWQQNGTNLPNGIITTVAGNGTGSYFGDGGVATNAELHWPSGVAVDATGNLFIADTFNNRIRKVGTNGIITTVAGNGGESYFGDGGVATNAELSWPSGVAVDASGNLFIADSANNVIRKVRTNGIITTVAGNGYDAGTGYGGYSGDSWAATNAELYYPCGAAVDATGNLFIADTANNVIRKVGTNGIIITVAGNGTGSYFGNGGAATNAELRDPNGVALDATGNLFIADSLNDVIREVGANGIIITVAGNGTASYFGDLGAATNAELYLPRGVAVDTSGEIFIADSYNNVIREVGTSGIITTVAGNGYEAGTGYGGYSGNGGAAANAELNWPEDVAVDASGNLFIADKNNNVVREVVAPGFSSGPTLVLNKIGFGNAGAYDVVVSNPYGSVTSSVVNLTVTIPVILSSPQITAGKTNFTFLLSGPAGSNYVLQVSTNLLNWDPISTSAIPVNGTINLTNAITNYNRRFYKVHLQ